MTTAWSQLDVSPRITYCGTVPPLILSGVASTLNHHDWTYYAVAAFGALAAVIALAGWLLL